MTTVHAYTNDQGTHDQPHKDLRRARAGALSIIPTTTGAAKAASLSLPQLKGRLDGVCAARPDPRRLRHRPRRAPRPRGDDRGDQRRVRGRLRRVSSPGSSSTQSDPIVSIDIVGNPHSCIVDSLSTMANGRLAKVLGWYDNEWGY